MDHFKEHFFPIKRRYIMLLIAITSLNAVSNPTKNVSFDLKDPSFAVEKIDFDQLKSKNDPAGCIKNRSLIEALPIEKAYNNFLEILDAEAVEDFKYFAPVEEFKNTLEPSLHVEMFLDPSISLTLSMEPLEKVSIVVQKNQFPKKTFLEKKDGLTPVEKPFQVFDFSEVKVEEPNSVPEIEELKEDDQIFIKSVYQPPRSQELIEEERPLSFVVKCTQFLSSICHQLIFGSLQADDSASLKSVPQEVLTKVDSIDFKKILEKKRHIIFHHHLNSNEMTLAAPILKSSIDLHYFDILNPSFIITKKQTAPLLEFLDTDENMSAKKTIEPRVFDQPIIAEAIERAPFEMRVNPNIDLKGFTQAIPSIVEKNNKTLFKKFWSSDVEILKQNPFAKSLLGMSAFRMTNRNFRMMHHSIDHLSQLNINEQTYEKRIEAKAFAAPLGNKEGYGVEIDLDFYENSNPLLLEHTIVFVIDGSKKTPKDHFESYKAAVYRSLKSLPQNTKFNIVFSGKNIQSLFSEPMPISHDKQVLAKRFLTELSSYQGRQRDLLLKACISNIPEYKEDQLTTFIVLADDISPRKRSNFLKDLEHLAKIKKQQFALHTTSLQRNDRSNLKILSSIGGGSDIPFRSTFSFIRNFAATVRSIRYPVLNEIGITPLSENVQVYPTHAPTAPVYLNKPYKLYAVVQNLEPFEICIQSYKDNKVVTGRKIITPVLNESLRVKIKNEIEHRKRIDALEFYLKNVEIAQLNEAAEYLDLLKF